MWKNKGWIWPQDQQHKHRGFVDGLWDVVRGKGPDMYIGDMRGPGPDWSDWARVPHQGYPPWRYDDTANTPPWAHRGYKVYDTKKRKYVPLEYVGPFHPPAAAHWGQPFGIPHGGGGGGGGGFGNGAEWNAFGHGPPPGAFQGPPQLRMARRHRKSMPKSVQEANAEWYPAYDFGGGLAVPAWLVDALGGGGMMGGGHPMIGGPPMNVWPGLGGHHNPHHGWPLFSSDGASTDSWPFSTGTDSDWGSTLSWP